MAKVISPPPAALYERDFPLWAERDGVESYAETILEHLLKLNFSPAARPRRLWMVTVGQQRPKLGRKPTTTLRDHLQTELPALYAGQRRPVTRLLAKDGVSADALPTTCPYTLQVLDVDWYPVNVRGIRDQES